MAARRVSCLCKCELGDRELVIEEWSSTLWQRDLSSDTCYKAAWLTKNILKNCENVDMMGYWLLTDFIDEWMVPGGVFHGGYGLFTTNGIPIALTLSGLHPGGYRQERRRISRKTGSAYDKWLEIGAPAKIGPDDLRYLSETSQPSFT